MLLVFAAIDEKYVRLRMMGLCPALLAKNIAFRPDTELTSMRFFSSRYIAAQHMLVVKMQTVRR
jgi:hypothetical protein